MFAKLATALAVGRRTAWRSAAYPSHHDETRRVAAPLGRTALVCRWTIDPASGQPICSWHADEAGSSPPDAASRSRPVLAFAASGAQPGPRQYERLDLWIGIVLVIVGAVAVIGFCAAAFAGKPEFGNYTDAVGTAVGLENYASQLPATSFALALLDASIIGAAAVSLATAYAIGDVLSLRHSLHRKPREAKAFYWVYCGLILVAAVLVLAPGTPLGLLTNAVQTLAGVLLSSATVFLLLLCNDKAVLGAWVNSRGLNLFTGAVIAILVVLSLILTLAVLFPSITETEMIEILAGGAALAIIVAIGWDCTRRSGCPPRRLRRPRTPLRGSGIPNARPGECLRSTSCPPRGSRSRAAYGSSSCADT